MAARLGTDYTKGSIPKKMLAFTLPFMAASALQVVYSVVDMIVVGNFVGSAAIAGVNTASGIVMFFTMFCFGYENGAQVYLSQILGAGRRDKLNAAIGTVFTVTAIMGIVASLINILFCRQLLSLFHTPAESMQHAINYLLIAGGGIIFSFGYNLVSTLQRAQGDSMRPFYFILAATIVNVVLDLLLVPVLHMGTRGAAIATVAGQAVSFALAFTHLMRNREAFGFDFKRESFRIDPVAFREVSKLGAVNILQYAILNVSILIVTSMVNSLGVTAAATMGVGAKIDDVINKLTLGIYTACATMVGQNFGAGELERVKKVVHCAWIFAAALYIVIALIYIFFGHQLFNVFTSDPKVLAQAHLWIRATLIGYLGVVIMRGTNGLVQGIGNARLALVFGIIDAVLARVGMAYLFGSVLGMGLFGYFLGFATAFYGTAIPGLIYYLSGAWKRRRLMVGD